MTGIDYGVAIPGLIDELYDEQDAVEMDELDDTDLEEVEHGS